MIYFEKTVLIETAMLYIQADDKSLEILHKVLEKDEDLRYSELLTDDNLEILIYKFKEHAADQSSKSMEIEQDNQIMFHITGILIYYTENIQHADMLL